MRAATQKREHGPRSITGESRIENVSVYKTSMYSLATRIRMTIWTTCAGLPFIRGTRAAQNGSSVDYSTTRRHLLMRAK